MNYPHYRYPPRIVLDLLLAGLSGWRRSFREHALAWIGRLSPPLRILGEDNIPLCGPCVLTVNHYYRPGFRAEWLALGIAAALPREMHWIMTGELTFPGKWYALIGRPISRFALTHAARVYGFTTMPPMPARASDVGARASAVRSVLEYIHHAHDPVLGLAPEGGDQPGGVLSLPPSGVGRFALMLAAAGLRFTPVGAYEADGFFHLHFGRSYELLVKSGLPALERDKQSARSLMEKIAGLLPVHLIGEFDRS